jgi:S-adenosylmethionine hydrolase
VLVALLTDFGLTDTYVGVMKAIIATLAPGVPIVDLTHAVPPQDVAAGAWHLATAVPYLPEEAVVLAVVDPGVGTTRRGIAVQCDARYFVAPDNGLLTRVLQGAQSCQAVTLDRPDLWLNGDFAPSATFHGRDIFAPVAARLAHGMPLSIVGSPLDPVTLTRLPLPRPLWQGNQVTAHVIHIDHFGNIITDIGPEFITQIFGAPALRAFLGKHVITARAITFGGGPTNAPFWYLDSSGHAGIAWRDGSAAAKLGAKVGAIITITLAPRLAQSETDQ